MTGDDLGVVVLAIGLVGTAAVLSNRLSARIRVPAPAFFLIAAAVTAELRPHAVQLPVTLVQNVVTVALAIILFDGGMHIGWQRFRAAAGAVIWTGVAGTPVPRARPQPAARGAAGPD